MILIPTSTQFYIKNRLKNQYRQTVNEVRWDNKYRSGYKFIYYAVHLIYLEIICDYMFDKLVRAETDDDLIGTKEDFSNYIDEFNVGKRIDQTNRADGIDSIDKNSLLMRYDQLMDAFKPMLVRERVKLQSKTTK